MDICEHEMREDLIDPAKFMNAMVISFAGDTMPLAQQIRLLCSCAS
jgi:hypothetical protein